MAASYASFFKASDGSEDQASAQPQARKRTSEKQVLGKLLIRQLDEALHSRCATRHGPAPITCNPATRSRDPDAQSLPSGVQRRRKMVPGAAPLAQADARCTTFYETP